MTSLQIADGISLPEDYVTKTAAICAQRRKGKTYTAAVIAEELVRLGHPWVAFDPTSAWWGLRASADGRREGLPVVIIGGDHGDLPLDGTSGHFLADLVVDRPGWYVLDLSLLGTRAAERTFAYEFADRLYRRKSSARHRFPMHFFVDEADLFAPQDKEQGDNKMLGAFQAIVRRAGILGLGCTLITQRPALLNKSVLTQLDLLILLRLVAGNDQDAIDKNYIQRAGSKEQRSELMGSLASLEVGEAWLWEPGADPALFARTKIRARRTFNSSATPKLGVAMVEPTRLADVDLAVIKEQMAEMIEKAESEDPKALRSRVRHLERQLADRPVEPVVETVIQTVETPIVPNDLVERLERIFDPVSALSAALRDALSAAVDLRHGRYEPKTVVPAAVPRRRHPPARVPTRRESVVRAEPTDGAVKLGKGERTVLEVLAEYPDGRTYNELAFLAGYSAKASTLGVILANLRRAGLVHPGNQPVRATAGGLDAVGGVRERPRGQALLDQWLRHPRMGEGERKVLLALIEAYPSTLSRRPSCRSAVRPPEPRWAHMEPRTLTVAKRKRPRGRRYGQVCWVRMAVRKWSMRCDECGHRFLPSQSLNAYGDGSKRTYHDRCMAYRQWRGKAAERLDILDLVTEVWAIDAATVRELAEGRASQQRSPDAPTMRDFHEANAGDKAWRVFYDLDDARKQKAKV